MKQRTLHRYARLRRYTPVRKRRPGLRRGEPTAEEKKVVRVKLFERADNRCEIRLHKQCWGNRELPFDGDVFERGHAVHIKSEGAGGTFTLDNLLLGCPPCHLGSMHTEGKKAARK
jgi:hypothetical protein